MKWRQGDVLMLDNTRFMHGRTAILDNAERQIATYFGYLKFALPNPEEPAEPIWRRTDFDPPRPPEHLVQQARERLLALPWDAAQQQHYEALAAQSLAAQKAIEDADTLPFEDWRQQYMDPRQLG